MIPMGVPVLFSAREEVFCYARAVTMKLIHRPPRKSYLDVVTSTINTAADDVASISAAPDIREFQTVASCVLSILAARYSFVLDDKFIDLLLSKHQRYGAAPLLRWGLVGIFIRIDSKWQRFLNMEKHELNAEISTISDSEPVFDTLQDILGYCILAQAIWEKKL